MDKKLLLAIFAIRFIYAGIHILTKEAFNGGMNTFVFVFYRQAAATLFLAPICIFFERKNLLSVPAKTTIKLFMLALIGIAVSLNTSSIAIKYTSSSLSAATENTIPVITFVLALLFRIETARIWKLSGFIKIIGVALFLAGIATVAFYKGPTIRSLNSHGFLTHESSSSSGGGSSGHGSSKQWILGCFLMVLANTEWCLWLVLQVDWVMLHEVTDLDEKIRICVWLFALQTSVLEELPSKLMFTTIEVMFSAFQAFLIALAAARDLSQWKLGLDVRLASIAYCGILITGVSFYLQTWCINRAGPVVVAMTTPLTLVITLAFLSLVLGEPVLLGSVLGGVLLVGGLYGVVYGKSKEQVVVADAHVITESNGHHLERNKNGSCRLIQQEAGFSDADIPRFRDDVA